MSFGNPVVRLGASIFLSLICAHAYAELAAGVYSPFKTAPTVQQGVPQQLAAQLRVRYSPGNNTGWWFCGQASTASAIDFLRGGLNVNGTPLTINDKVDQLDWFHNRLIENFANYALANHYEADMDWLLKIMTTLKNDEFDSIRTQGQNSPYGRALFRDNFLTNLKSRVAVVLRHSQGHFVTVWKVDYQPKSGGGTVYYYDPQWGEGNMVSEPFATFLDSMPSGQYGYSALMIKRRW